jgi:hypothetical protein
VAFTHFDVVVVVEREPAIQHTVTDVTLAVDDTPRLAVMS